jgi:hypothetical protein
LGLLSAITVKVVNIAIPYCIGIASIANTFFSIALLVQYCRIHNIGIGIANTFLNIGTGN